jgi:hypothetical protein
MRKTINRIHQGENTTLVVAKLEGNPCTPGTLEAFKELMAMVRAIADLPDLIRSETNCPDFITIKHLNGCWVVESSSAIERPIDEY